MDTVGIEPMELVARERGSWRLLATSKEPLRTGGMRMLVMWLPKRRVGTGGTPVMGVWKGAI